ncbi:MOSC domain-containing protein [Patulibacter minatonensis]|uniref:MOSC domain-containing protein n=1 Tax=Patulibacter minatonensis TaxID=298163 RepID=UPI00047B7DA6|nr:MOSC domain-containing protein [Patulibacter minatonensis]
MASTDREDHAPRVTRLSVTPIKGFALQHPDEVRLERSGAVGDRDFVVVDDRGRLVSITKTGAWVDLTARYDRGSGRLDVRDRDGGRWDATVVPGDPVGVDMFGLRTTPGHVVEGPWSALLSERAGKDVRLVLLDRAGDGSDVHPVTVLGEATVTHLAERAGVGTVDPRRFRMLLAVSGTPAHAEDGWAGRTVRVGRALIEVGGPVPRCAGVTRHPDEGGRDLPVVRMIKAYRGMQETELGPGVALGVYARVLEPGAVRVGDALVFED